MLAARWLAQRGAGTLVLASRGGGATAATSAGLLGLSGVRFARCDAAQAVDVRRVVAGVPRLGGVWHAAGVLADGLLPEQGARSLRRVYGAKAHGAWLLQRACAASPLASCVHFSSIAALFGGSGQANYSGANACLDALASCRRASALVGSSVQWGPWALVGMASGGAVNARLRASGIGLLSLSHGEAAFAAAVQAHAPPVLCAAQLSWHRLLGAAGELRDLVAVERARRVLGGERRRGRAQFGPGVRGVAERGAGGGGGDAAHHGRGRR